MSAGEVLIHTFYTAFKAKDFITMQDCYAQNARFTDAVFKDLNATETRKMWEMLLKKGKDLSIEFSNITATDSEVSANWEATYTFSLTGKKVVNKVKASFDIEDGKIINHCDSFNFYTWARQAFGFKGMLIGWTPFFKNKVRRTASDNLKKFMALN
ncbi:MAG: nuclear transport factor 2 family protein [Bacteroidota bacterium]